MRCEPVPVLMYHSVAPEIKGWAFKYLSVEPAMFEDQVATMARAGFTPVGLADLHAYVAGGRSLPPKSIVLTFDDGYLDNWVYAFPILKKYGFKATIFVSTDFIDRRDAVRPNLDDVWSGRSAPGSLVAAGFLSLREMKIMLASGLVDIQGHCRTHTWYFTGKTILDFHNPGDQYPWLAWNASPERKPLYLEEDQTSLVPLGSPIYEYEKSLVARRFFPDPLVAQAVTRHVADAGGQDFFARHDWRQDLFRMAAEASAGAAGGRYETDAERRARLEDEIGSSKHQLESLLQKQVDFLCWPGGGYDDTAVAIARDAGYRAWTLASRLAASAKNLPGEDPSWIRRLPAAPWWIYRGRRRCAVDGEFLRLVLEEYRGSAFSRLRLRAYKLRRLVASYLG